jgi:hypothetical protein
MTDRPSDRPDPDEVLRSSGEHFMESSHRNEAKRKSTGLMGWILRDNHFAEGFFAEMMGRHP